MLTVQDYERIRQAYYVEQKSIRQIGRETGHGYWTVRKALENSAPQPYTLSAAKEAPKLGAYKAQIEALLAENERLPRKQRYTSGKIYRTIRQAGYLGAESTVRYYVSQRRKALRRFPVYLPLAYDPGVDAQVDWGEATVIMGGEQVVVQLFIMRLCYSRKLFVMAFPTQRQEAFLLGHVLAFAHFGAVPQRISYDNLKTAVQRILQGRNRIEQTDFVRFRSHYLFESRFCTPAQGHEKGGVESAVGYSRRNFLTPMPAVADFDELNAPCWLPAAPTTNAASHAQRPSPRAGKRNNHTCARCRHMPLPAAAAGKSRSTAMGRSPSRPTAIPCRSTRRASSSPCAPIPLASSSWPTTRSLPRTSAVTVASRTSWIRSITWHWWRSDQGHLSMHSRCEWRQHWPPAW
jgi:transposase